MPLSLRLPRAATIQGRVAALELLGRRGATSRADVVLKAAGDLNPTVAKAASDALAGVVTDKNLPALYSLLESMGSASDANAAAVQHAIAVAMKNMPVSDKAAAITSRMKANEAKKSLYYSVLAEAGVPRGRRYHFRGLLGRNFFPERRCVPRVAERAGNGARRSFA